jgi:hypothetical protein
MFFDCSVKFARFRFEVGLSRTEARCSLEESIYRVKNAQFGELVVFLPGRHFAGGPFNNFILVERGPILAFPPGVVIVAIDPISQIDCCIQVDCVWLLVCAHRKIRALTGRHYQVIRARAMRSRLVLRTFICWIWNPEEFGEDPFSRNGLTACDQDQTHKCEQPWPQFEYKQRFTLDSLVV